MSKEIDHLTEDSQIANQSYVCLSFVSPEGIKGCTMRALKVRGVYPSYEKAQERAAELQESDPNFHVFIGEVGKWLPWDPNPHEGAKDQIYYEKEMQELVAGYKENLANSKKEVRDRADECAASSRKSLPSGNGRKDKVVERMQKKLAAIKEKKGIATEDMEHLGRDIDSDVKSYNNYMESDSVEDKIKEIQRLQKN